MSTFQRIQISGISLILIGIAGCGPKTEVVVEKRPRPVVAELLRKQPPPNAALITASAGAWKTEQIGFEVGGRVEFVVEQNASIQGRIYDADDQLIFAGDPIARLESERFRLAVARAKADVETAEQNVLAARTDLEQTIPAQIASAVAKRTAAESEYSRSKQLVARNAGSQSDLDQSKANFDSAFAEVQRLEATLEAQKAQIGSLESVLEQAKQGQRDAERNLEDCTLYSSFTGQIADVSVVPGSIVQAGAPVVSLQTMDPIKVELEVSADVSRRLNRTDVYPVYVTMPDGQIDVHQGYLYQVDPVGDPLTRTYTVILLVINKQLSSNEQTGIATTPNIWRLDLPFLPGAGEGRLFVDEKAILRDDQGAYLWQITNSTSQGRSPRDHVYEVRKIRITPLDFKSPYFAGLVFQEVIVNDEAFDPHMNLVIGELTVTEGTPEEWNGTRVLVDSGNRWMLRPGDLVKVDLSNTDKTEGYYVPLDAIARRNDEAAIFVLQGSGNNSKAVRIPVRLVSSDLGEVTSSLCRIEAMGNESLEGMLCITKGTHYLVDGEPVNAVASASDDQGVSDDAASAGELSE
ncbi:Inner membrane protein YibH [Rubripirellula lacrimiformis]|uniref:Inner membrane protein YibH n=1 Tax=Rubripirellula lacrimiformis TaxID=1930273 RepID=A0A517NA34_9BACT|nr:HlyD family secretion protein [Rubripirellula lacrimiformis]QDT03997.1 Inner membrane protein YibH [Rubripirellula lacrimiformis]